MPSRLFALLVVLVMLPLQALASGPFTGSWRLDKDASTDTKPMMLAQGVPQWQANIASNMGMTQVIEDQGERIDVLYKVSIFTERTNVALDGQPKTEQNKRGDDQIVVRRRDADGSVRATVTFDVEGVTHRLETHRHLIEGGRRMRVDIQLFVGDAPPVQMHQLYDRLE